MIKPENTLTNAGINFSHYVYKKGEFSEFYFPERAERDKLSYVSFHLEGHMKLFDSAGNEVQDRPAGACSLDFGAMEPGYYKMVAMKEGSRRVCVNPAPGTQPFRSAVSRVKAGEKFVIPQGMFFLQFSGKSKIKKDMFGELDFAIAKSGDIDAVALLDSAYLLAWR